MNKQPIQRKPIIAIRFAMIGFYSLAERCRERLTLRIIIK